MNSTYIVEPIGKVKLINDMSSIKLYSNYLPGLTQIENFSHLQIIWWGHLTDKRQDREKLIARKLFKNAPNEVGIFGTRAPTRPNPILISAIKVDAIDAKKGIIYTPHIDAEPDTPVLDIKPYFPMDRVKNCKVPKWFEHWPKWAEDAESFNWKNEINFQ
jgi:tRNA-Thr(GGU) m(6)t(6)A37 methyltransferase TsaA